jgi:hypothetical protein
LKILGLLLRRHPFHVGYFVLHGLTWATYRRTIICWRWWEVPNFFRDAITVIRICRFSKETRNCPSLEYHKFASEWHSFVNQITSVDGWWESRTAEVSGRPRSWSEAKRPNSAHKKRQCRHKSNFGCFMNISC